MFAASCCQMHCKTEEEVTTTATAALQQPCHCVRACLLNVDFNQVLQNQWRSFPGRKQPTAHV